MSNYWRFEVVRGGMVVAYTTTLQEANAEASLCGGSVRKYSLSPLLRRRLLTARRQNPPRGQRALDRRAGSKLRAITELSAYIGTILAPKSLTPCAIYLDQALDSSSYTLYSPDLTTAYATGYFGYDAYEYIEIDGNLAVRQHMTGLLAPIEDAKLGLGAAAYMAGPLVLQASLENSKITFSEIPEDGDFYDNDEAVTYSGDGLETGSRTYSAQEAWAKLRKRHVASQRLLETDYYTDVYLTEASLRADGIPDDVTINSVKPESVQVEGRKEHMLDIMSHTQVLKAGWVLDLNPKIFGDTSWRPPSSDAWPHIFLARTYLDQATAWLRHIEDSANVGWEGRDGYTERVLTKFDADSSTLEEATKGIREDFTGPLEPTYLSATSLENPLFSRSR